MATLLFANFASTTLAGPLSNTQTTCNVAAGSGTLFPQPGTGQYFKLIFLDAATKTVREIVHVTATSGDTFTIVRGQEGTAQANWNAGDIAFDGVTAGTFGAFAQTANLPASFVSGQDTGTANAVQVAATTPAVSAPSAGQLFLITKGSSPNTGPTTFQIASGAAYSVVYEDGSALNPYDWLPQSAAILYFTGGVMQYLANMGNYGVKTYFGRNPSGTADAIVLQTVPPVPALIDNVDVEFVNGPVANSTSTPTIAVSGLPPATIVRSDGSSCQATDLPANALVQLKADTTLFAGAGGYRLRSAIAPGQVRQKLTGNLNLYVRSDGSDSNDGRANTAARAFLTIQGCWNAIFGLYDPAGFVITINVGLGIGGTYAGATLGGYAGSVTLAGDPAAPASVVVNSPPGLPSVLNHPAGGPALTVMNFVADYSFSGTAPVVESTINSTARLVVGPNMTFRCNNNRPNLVEVASQNSGAFVLFLDGVTTTISGTGSRGIFLSTTGGAGMSLGQAGGTVTFVSPSTIAYTTTFTNAVGNASQSWGLGNFSGITATGKQANADFNASIQLGGKTLPGNAAPTANAAHFAVVA